MNIKRDKTYQARMDGLKYALEIVERGGIEELKKEIRVRNAGDDDGCDTCSSQDLFVNAWMPLPKPCREEKQHE